MFRCIRFSLGHCLTRKHGRFTGKEAKLPSVSNSVWIKKDSLYLWASACGRGSCHIRRSRRTWTTRWECNHLCKALGTLSSEGARGQPTAGTLSYWPARRSPRHSWFLQTRRTRVSEQLRTTLTASCFTPQAQTFRFVMSRRCFKFWILTIDTVYWKDTVAKAFDLKVTDVNYIAVQL